jgi:hypothetical protein
LQDLIDHGFYSGVKTVRLLWFIDRKCVASENGGRFAASKKADTEGTEDPARRGRNQKEISRGGAVARRREKMGQIAPSILRASAPPRELFLLGANSRISSDAGGNNPG